MFNSISDMPDWVNAILFPTNRWLHVVCTTLLVGGTLFYEFVIPKAIEELKPEAAMSVLERCRWAFRNIVYLGSAVLILTGAASIWNHWPMYGEAETTHNFKPVRPWVAAHVGVGILSLVVAIVTVQRKRPPRRPLVWLRVNFVVLLVVVFLAAVTRYVRLTILYDDWHTSLPFPLHTHY